MMVEVAELRVNDCCLNAIEYLHRRLLENNVPVFRYISMHKMPGKHFRVGLGWQAFYLYVSVAMICGSEPASQRPDYQSGFGKVR